LKASKSASPIASWELTPPPPAFGESGRPNAQGQSSIAAVRQASRADIRDTEGEIAVRADVLRAGLLAVRQSGLDQELCHEAERAGIEGALRGNRLQEGQQRM